MSFNEMAFSKPKTSKERSPRGKYDNVALYPILQHPHDILKGLLLRTLGISG